MGRAEDAAGGIAGSVLLRWFDAVDRGEVPADQTSVLRCLAELRDVGEPYA